MLNLVLFVFSRLMALFELPVLSVGDFKIHHNSGTLHLSNIGMILIDWAENNNVFVVFDAKHLLFSSLAQASLWNFDAAQLTDIIFRDPIFFNSIPSYKYT